MVKLLFETHSLFRTFFFSERSSFELLCPKTPEASEVTSGHILMASCSESSAPSETLTKPEPMDSVRTNLPGFRTNGFDLSDFFCFAEAPLGPILKLFRMPLDFRTFLAGLEASTSMPRRLDLFKNFLSFELTRDWWPEATSVAWRSASADRRSSRTRWSPIR